MNVKMTKIAAALALTVAATGAHAVPTVMNVTAGYFGMGVFTGKTTFPIALIDSTKDITDQYNLPGWDTTVGQATFAMAPGAVVSFDFGTGATDQVNAFFAPSAVGAAGGGPAPVFNGSLVNGNVSTIDMSSFFANWGGTNFNQGASVTNLTMSSCVAGVSCNWSMSWKSTIVGGPFNGQTGTWGLSGTIAAVPEASTYGMMLAGLGLVGFAARRRTRRIA